MDDTPEATPPTQIQKLAAEAIGTFILVLVGVGSLAFANYSQLGQAVASGASISASDLTGVDTVATALAFGLTLVGLGFAFRRVSGGHFNPVISLGEALAGRLAWAEALVMSAAQLVGGIVGGVVLLILMKGYKGFDAFTFPIGPSVWGDKFNGYHWWAAIILELLLSAVLVVAYLAATDLRNARAVSFAPVIVGLTFAGLYLVSLPAVGGGVNPARSLGADLFSGGDAAKGVWVFILGPVLGAAAGGALYPALFGRDRDVVPGSGLTGGAPKQSYPGGQAWGQPGGYQQGGYQAPAQSGGYQAPGQAGGYQAPAQQDGGYQAPAQEQPIIQDGWQWDPQAQQWIPAQQQPPAGGQATPGQGGESTQIRPPDGV